MNKSYDFLDDIESVPEEDSQFKINYIVFRTELGWTGIAGTYRGLLAVILPKRNKNKVIDELKSKLQRKFPLFRLVKNEKIFNRCIQGLIDYFNIRNKDFDYKLDLNIFTTFQLQVYNVVRTIPYGHTVTYHWVAKQIGKSDASRAVGQALKENLLPIIIPCHRVIKSDKKLCGFSSGVNWKKRLLSIEGVILK